MIFNFVFCVGSDFSVFKIFKDEGEDLSKLPFRVLSILKTKYYELFNSYILDNVSVNIPNCEVKIIGYFDDKFNFTSLLDFSDFCFKFDSIDNFKNLNNSFNHSDKDVKKHFKSMKGVKNEVSKN